MSQEVKIFSYNDIMEIVDKQIQKNQAFIYQQLDKLRQKQADLDDLLSEMFKFKRGEEWKKK